MRDMPLPLALGGFALAVLFIGGAVGYGIASEHANETTQTCTVTDKDRTTTSEGVSDARIYTEECGTIRVADLLTRGQHNAADIYAVLEPGNAYDVTTVGWRIPLLSDFPVVLGTPVEATTR